MPHGQLTILRQHPPLMRGNQRRQPTLRTHHALWGARGTRGKHHVQRRIQRRCVRYLRQLLIDARRIHRVYWWHREYGYIAICGGCASSEYGIHPRLFDNRLIMRIGCRGVQLHSHRARPGAGHKARGLRHRAGQQDSHAPTGGELGVDKQARNIQDVGEKIAPGELRCCVRKCWSIGISIHEVPDTLRQGAGFSRRCIRDCGSGKTVSHLR